MSVNGGSFAGMLVVGSVISCPPEHLVEASEQAGELVDIRLRAGIQQLAEASVRPCQLAADALRLEG